MPSIVMMIVTSVYSIVDGFFVPTAWARTPSPRSTHLPRTHGALRLRLHARHRRQRPSSPKQTLGEEKTKRRRTASSRCSSRSWRSAARCSPRSSSCSSGRSPMPVGATELTIDDCVLYGRILLVSLPLFMLQNSFQSFLATAEKTGLRAEGDGVRGGPTTWCSTSCLSTSFRSGLAGAALATALSQAVGAAIPLAPACARTTRRCGSDGRALTCARFGGPAVMARARWW